MFIKFGNMRAVGNLGDDRIRGRASVKARLERAHGYKGRTMVNSKSISLFNCLIKKRRSKRVRVDWNTKSGEGFCSQKERTGII